MQPKTDSELKAMRESGRILASVLENPPWFALA
jgi:hypothetical protein